MADGRNFQKSASLDSIQPGRVDCSTPRWIQSRGWIDLSTDWSTVVDQSRRMVNLGGSESIHPLDRSR
eukprot:5692157-Prymnesium_polylepis.1